MVKVAKRVGVAVLHLHEHNLIHTDLGAHNIGKFNHHPPSTTATAATGTRWKLLSIGGCVEIGKGTDPTRGLYLPPEAINGIMTNKKKKNNGIEVHSIPAQPTYDIWSYGVFLYHLLTGNSLQLYDHYYSNNSSNNNSKKKNKNKKNENHGESGGTTVAGVVVDSIALTKIGKFTEEQLRAELVVLQDDDPARDLLKHLLHPNPLQRYQSMRSVLDHPFFHTSVTNTNVSSNNSHVVGSEAASTSAATAKNMSRNDKVNNNNNSSGGNGSSTTPPRTSPPRHYVDVHADSDDHEEKNNDQQQQRAGSGGGLLSSFRNHRNPNSNHTTTSNGGGVVWSMMKKNTRQQQQGQQPQQTKAHKYEARIVI